MTIQLRSCLKKAHQVPTTVTTAIVTTGALEGSVALCCCLEHPEVHSAWLTGLQKEQDVCRGSSAEGQPCLPNTFE